MAVVVGKHRDAWSLNFSCLYDQIRKKRLACLLLGSAARVIKQALTVWVFLSDKSGQFPNFLIEVLQDLVQIELLCFVPCHMKLFTTKVTKVKHQNPHCTRSVGPTTKTKPGCCGHLIVWLEAKVTATFSSSVCGYQISAVLMTCQHHQPCATLNC